MKNEFGLPSIDVTSVRRAHEGVRFVASVTVVLLALLLTDVAEGQGGAPQARVRAGEESPGTCTHSALPVPQKVRSFLRSSTWAVLPASWTVRRKLSVAFSRTLVTLPNEGLRIRIFLVMETGAITIMLAGRRQNR